MGPLATFFYSHRRFVVPLSTRSTYVSLLLFFFRLVSVKYHPFVSFAARSLLVRCRFVSRIRFGLALLRSSVPSYIGARKHGAAVPEDSCSVWRFVWSTVGIARTRSLASWVRHIVHAVHSIYAVHSPNANRIVWVFFQCLCIWVRINEALLIFSSFR